MCVESTANSFTSDGESKGAIVRCAMEYTNEATMTKRMASEQVNSEMC